jgi:glycosyltransferase involved in cell wall biosynthesis
MRVVLVNWARVWEGAAHGGGANGYMQGLALALAARGHRVSTISSGNLHLAAPGRPRARGPLRLWRYNDWQGIHSYEFVNAPVLSPSLHQFREPMGEVSAPHLEAAFDALLEELAPDAVHFQNLEGFSVGCVDAARRRAPVVCSLHNYHTICPQVYLMQGNRRPCLDYENGHACARCITTPKPNVWIDRTLRTDPHAGSDGPFDPGPPPAPPLRIRIGRGLARLRRAWRAAPIVPVAPVLTPLTNSVTPEPPSSLPPNAYAERRAAMVSMLSACDAVLAVSDFVRRRFAATGVDESVLRTMHIGSRAADFPRESPAPRPGGPVRLLFLGYNNYYKGLPMLADALELLPDEVLARISLSAHVIGAPAARKRLSPLRTRLAALTIREGYRFEDIPNLAAAHDAGLVTSVWWDNGPQTVFEFFGCGLPVIAADIGGIPDFVRHAENGLLFRAGDRDDLSRTLREVAAEPELLSRLAAGVRPPKSMAYHAEEVESLYAELVAARGTPPLRGGNLGTPPLRGGSETATESRGTQRPAESLP